MRSAGTSTSSAWTRSSWRCERILRRAKPTGPAPCRGRHHPEGGFPMICAVCQQEVLESVLELAPAPVAGILWRSREEAIGAPRGEMHLAVCPSCGVVRNIRFDPQVMAYTPAYENSQHFSPAFR